MENNGLIAVIDDDVRVLDSLQGLLESVGYSTAVFSSAEDLLEYGHASDFSCVIADIGLPGMNGVSLRRRLSISDADLNVILITAQSDSALLSEVEISDELRFFEKPFDSVRLLSAVATLVRRLDAPTPDD